MKQQYLLSIPKKQKKELEQIAANNGYSLNALIMFIINDYLEKRKGEQR